MSESSTPWRWVRDFVRTIFAAARQALSPKLHIEIVEQDDRRLVLSGGGRELVIDRRFRTVKAGTPVLALFDQIQSIVIQHDRHDDGPDTWSVSLHLGGFSRVYIGRTRDATDASIAAAHLGTMTGKKVLAR